jgi:tryptophan synthase alpha chain
MGRLSDTFQNHAFIAYTVAGDPDSLQSAAVARAIVEGGADVLELGIPFTDPVADGPVIQEADQRALSAGANAETAFALTAAIREYSDIPIVLFTYANPVFRMGLWQFYKRAQHAGADAVLIVDMPVEEAAEALIVARKTRLDQIFLVSQTTSGERLEKIAGKAGGFLYLVSTLGITGMREHLEDEALNLIERARQASDLPLAVGFGIGKPEHARTLINAGADGVIVGSAIVSIIERNLNDADVMSTEIRKFVSGMKSAVSDRPQSPKL